MISLPRQRQMNMFAWPPSPASGGDTKVKGGRASNPTHVAIEPTPIKPDGITIVADSHGITLEPTPILKEFAALARSNFDGSVYNLQKTQTSNVFEEFYQPHFSFEENKREDLLLGKTIADPSDLSTTLSKDPSGIAQDSTNTTRRKIGKRCQTKKWEERFEDLVDYKNEHGHCDVAYHRGDDSDLVQWVKRQRYHFSLIKTSRQTAASRTLTRDRIDQLNSIGFVWSAHDATWDANFRKMCSVGSSSAGLPIDNYLGTWIKRQRQQYRLGTLSPYRARQLEEAGFDWNA